MNYFELFGIPVQLKLSKSDLSERFFQLSRQFHPDYFATKSAVERSVALDRSAMLNKAYRIFQNPDETIKYVLQLNGLIEEEEKYELPADFLMEVLEINEQLMDSQAEAFPTTASGASEIGDELLKQQVENLEREIYEPVKDIIENYKEDITPKEKLLQVKEYYYKKKYLDRIKKQLDGML